MADGIWNQGVAGSIPARPTQNIKSGRITVLAVLAQLISEKVITGLHRMSLVLPGEEIRSEGVPPAYQPVESRLGESLLEHSVVVQFLYRG